MTDHINNNEPKTFTEAEVIELLRRARATEQAETQKTREERELPLEITSSLEQHTKQQHQDNFKRYKRDVTKYHHNEWTIVEEINKSFLPKLRHYTVDTTQVVNAHYKGAEISRLHGRAATEIFEQLSIIKDGEISTEEAHQLLDEAIESAKRLSIHAWIQGKQHDEDAKDYAIRALKLPPSLKHLETKDSGSKREAFDEDLSPCTTKPTINKYFGQQPPTLPMDEVEEDIQTSQAGTTIEEEDVDILDVEDQKTTLEEGDVGTQPSTKTTISPILTELSTQQLQQQSMTSNYTIPSDGILPG
ncbi:hypothetical protein INT47_004477, partial [Mucor saturninus]